MIDKMIKLIEFPKVDQSVFTRLITVLLFFAAFLSVNSERVIAQELQLTLDRVLLNNITPPWGMTFINSNEVLFTEKRGRLYHYNIEDNIRTEITGLPMIAEFGQGGLLDVAIHPEFHENNWVYLSYTVRNNNLYTTAMGRGKLINNQLVEFTELFRALPMTSGNVHFGSRMVFDKEKYLYLSVGDRGIPSNAQQLNNHHGKVMRFHDDGSVPTDNPFINEPGARPEIYTFGNRNIQGMAVHPVSGEVYAHEHGPRGGDELNLIQKGVNYGWPVVTFGINYDGSPISSDTTAPGMELPIKYWIPSIAPCGMTFIRNEQAENEADILIGALAGTHIHWLKLKDNEVIASTRSMNGYARFRDIRQAPNGKLYALTESPNRFILLQSNIPIINSVSDSNNNSYNFAHLYPNPSTGESVLSFHSFGSHLTEVNLLSSEAKIIRKIQATYYPEGAHELRLDSAYLISGVYLLEIKQGSKRNILKWVKI